MEITKKGHPSGLYMLFTTEMWERFSYYGMRGLLILYLTKSLVEGGLGFSDSDAGLLYGLYTGLVYFTPIIGGWLADNYLGQRKAIILGGILMMFGQFALASQASLPALYTGLTLLILGNGLFKPNISTIVGKLYEQGDPRKDAAFTIFYMGINLGAFLAPLVCGYFSDDLFATKQIVDGKETILGFGYRYGFLAAGVGMLLGQITFMALAQKYLGDIGKLVKKEHRDESQYGSLTKEEKHRVSVIFILMLFVIFFWAGFEQAGSTLSLYTDRYIDRHIGDFEIPTPWFQSLNPALIVLLAPLFTVLWVALGKVNKEPSTPVKMAFGMILLGVGFLFMVGAVMERGGDVEDVSIKAGLIWLVMTYIFHTMGELCLSPVGLSMVTKMAPLKYASLLMGVWFIANFIANFLSGLFVQYVGAFGAYNIFLGIAVFVSILGVVLLLLSRKLSDMMHGIK
jgi:POT family proton-dependent oligopeptide transporter